MKIKNRIAAAALAASFLFILPVSAEAGIPQTGDVPDTEETAPTFLVSSGGVLRGLYISSKNNKDYPEKVGLTAASLRGQAAEIVDFAAQNKFNTLFYEMSPRADALYGSKYLPSSRFTAFEEGRFSLVDPFKILYQTARMEGVGVSAAVSPLYAGETTDTYAESSPVTQHPDWFITEGTSLYFNPKLEAVRDFWANICAEIASSYDLDGILLTMTDGPAFLDKPAFWDGAEQLIIECLQAARQQDSELFVGVSLPHTMVDAEEISSGLLSIGDFADFVMPEMDVSVSSPVDYEDYLNRWTELFKYSSAQVFTQNLAKKVQAPLADPVVFGDDLELNYQLYSNLLSNVKGYMVDSYQDLASPSLIAQQLLSVPDSIGSDLSALKSNSKQQITLSASDPLIFTTDRQYFISGQCAPDVPLTMNGQLVEDITKDGYFGIYVDLVPGANSFIFQQGEEERKLTVYTSRNLTQHAVAIDDIQESSVFPKENDILFEGSTLTLSCVAPYGGTVTARFQNESYVLQPEKQLMEEDIGKPVRYSLQIQPTTSEHAKVKNLGRVSYVLAYEDFTSKYRSAGEVYLVGSSSRLAVRVDDSLGRIYQDPSRFNLRGNLLFGTCDFASLTNNDFFALHSGGYIHRNDVSIVEGFVDIEKSIQTVGLQTNEKGENLIFIGGEGLPYHVSYEDETRTLTLQLYNLSSMPKSLSHLASTLFEKISVTNNEQRGICTIDLRLKPSKTLWGYHVSFQNGNMILQCKTPPKIQPDNMPLAGLSVVLDPGHGGSDLGASGVLGKRGAYEKNITLIYAQSLRRRLEALGADVYLTRADDNTTMADEDRILTSDFKDAYFYISFHTNSSDQDSDAWEEQGFRVYYNYELSRDFGYMLYRNLTQQLRVEPNGFSGDDLNIGQVPLARSVVLCPGSITNPADYERLTDPVQIYKTSCIISDTIQDYLWRYNPAKSE